MLVHFYIVSCSEDTQNKADYITADVEVDATVKNSKEFETPTILVNVDPTPYNAVYCPEFGRWYSITSKVKQGQLWLVGLLSDPLTSFYVYYKATAGIVDRQQNDGNAYIPDSEIILKANTDTYTRLFPSSIGETATVLLTVAGGAGSPL